MPKRKHRPHYERYDLNRSPLSLRPTQKDLAELLGMSRDELRRNASYKEQCIVRRTETINRKLRNLAYPNGPLRTIHEKLKFHLNKIKQPEYLFSPRKGRGQRDNAYYHVGNSQFLTLDFKQFYPSTTFSMVKNWLITELGMYEDVAGLIAELVTVDGVVSFGSPLTPVLVTLVHRKLFDDIADLCDDSNLTYSVWVDNVTISGAMVKGEIVRKIRNLIASHGLKSHEIEYTCSNRPVFTTGIGVIKDKLVARDSYHFKLKWLWQDFHAALELNDREDLTQRLLAQMGSVRHIVGSKSEMGRSLSDRMNSLKQKRDKQRGLFQKSLISARAAAIVSVTGDVAPW
jgi:RNA-directed DNA polymerase